MLEILVGIVKHQEPLVFQRGQFGPGPVRQLGQGRLKQLGIRVINRGIGGIHPGQPGGDDLDPHLGVCRVKPDMGIKPFFMGSAIMHTLHMAAIRRVEHSRKLLWALAPEEGHHGPGQQQREGLANKHSQYRHPQPHNQKCHTTTQPHNHTTTQPHNQNRRTAIENAPAELQKPKTQRRRD